MTRPRDTNTGSNRTNGGLSTGRWHQWKAERDDIPAAPLFERAERETQRQPLRSPRRQHDGDSDEAA